MKVCSETTRWHPWIGVLAVGMLAFGLSLEGATPTKYTNESSANKSRIQKTEKLSVSRTRITGPFSTVSPDKIAGATKARVVYSQMPVNIKDIPVAETITVDYRNDEGDEYRRLHNTTGPIPLLSEERMMLNGGGVAAGGCSFTIDCDDGKPCTTDRCKITPGEPAGSGFCENPTLPAGNAGDCGDGIFCNGKEVCDGVSQTACVAVDTTPCDSPQVCDEFQNACVASCTNNTALCDNICVGGDNADKACATSGNCPGGECRLNPCAPKTCTDGVCVPGDNPCGSGADCLIRFCKVGGACTVQSGCANSPCETDADCNDVTGACQDGTLCFLGRCCTADPNEAGNWICNKAKEVDCGGLWFAGPGGRVGGSFACDPTGGGCPKYSSGIGPAGELITLVGPVSESIVPISAPQGPGFALNKLGDDYTLSNDPSHIDMEFIRLVGGMIVPDRISVEIYDDATPPNFIQDFFFSTSDEIIAVRTIRFSPPLTIPSKGFVVVRIARRFSPDAKWVWMSTTVTPDVGGNDPTILWVNSGPTTSFLPNQTEIMAFEIVGVSRDKVDKPIGACCDIDTGTCSEKEQWVCRGEGNSFAAIGTVCGVCGGGSTVVSESSCRRCSNGDPCTGDVDCSVGTCDPVQSLCKSCGIDTVPFCRDGITSCVDNGDPDCVGIGDGKCVQPGLLCDITADCNGASCAGTCEAITACLTGACCAPDDLTGDGCTDGVLPGTCPGGVCFGGTNHGTSCTDDSVCTGGGFCDLFFQGFGQDCQPNCCRQPRDRWRDDVAFGPWSGGDNCGDAYVHEFVGLTAPVGQQVAMAAPGEPPVVVTITGDSGNATNTLASPDTCFGFSDDAEAERGWWEAFSIDSCAFVWWDICCTSCEGGCNPGYIFMADKCDPVDGSCPTSVIARVNPNFIPPLTRVFNRGEPFCEAADNITVFYGPLGAGTYYIPFFAALQAINGPYQMHLNVQTCPTAACCTNEPDGLSSTCSIINSDKEVIIVTNIIRTIRKGIRVIIIDHLKIESPYTNL